MATTTECDKVHIRAQKDFYSMAYCDRRNCRLKSSGELYPEKHGAHISWFGIDDEYLPFARGKGYGPRIYACLEQFFRQKKINEVSLFPRDEDAAHFWKKMGYRPPPGWETEKRGYWTKVIRGGP